EAVAAAKQTERGNSAQRGVERERGSGFELLRAQRAERRRGVFGRLGRAQGGDDLRLELDDLGENERAAAGQEYREKEEAEKWGEAHDQHLAGRRRDRKELDGRGLEPVRD